MVRFAKIFTVVLALLIVAGCSKPPEVEMAAANASIQAAKSAEAEQYVPKAYRAAMDSINAATAAKTEQDAKFVLFRSYGKSKEMFVRADAIAKKVSTDAVAEKERVKNEVTMLLADTKVLLDSVQVVVNKAPVGKGNKADIELIKSDLQSVFAAYDDANMEFTNGKYLTARSKVNVVKQKGESILMEVQTAIDKVKKGRK
jgi:outer membrane murein-binding lipoprotein Lpp